jgi:hypothetical protein
MHIKKISRSEYIGARKFLEKSSKNIIDKKATFTILIFLSLRNGLFVHRSEQRQFLEQLVEIPLISQKINLNNHVGGK